MPEIDKVCGPVETQIEESPDERPQEDADEVTGASPGTAQACSDLGLNSLESNLERFGIKPPGVS